MASRLTPAEWLGCLQLSEQHLRKGDPPGPEELSLWSPALPRFASCAALLCLRHGESQWFRLGAAALSLLMLHHEGWREQAGTAAALRFAADESDLPRAELLADLPQLAEPAIRLLAAALPHGRFAYSVRLTPAGLDLLTPDNFPLSQWLPAELFA